MSSPEKTRIRRSVPIVMGFIVLVSGVCMSWWIRATAKAPRPNVLVISLCSVRADHMSCYGYRRKTTQRFDDLAEESIVFDNAITQWPKTVPAFAALMTGKYGHTNGVMRVTPFQHLDDEHRTLAEILRGGGYATAVFNSTPVLSESTNILRGFDTVEETWRLPHEQSFSETAKRAVAWLRQPRSSPFLLWVHFNNAHQPYYPLGVRGDMFVGDAFYDSSRRVKINKGPLKLRIPPARHPYAEQITRNDLGGVHPSAVLPKNPHELDYYVAQYDAAICSADKTAGIVLREVRKLGLLDNTIVVLVGDHGESLGEHNYFFGHGRLPYNECARVPLIIRPPGGVYSRHVSAPVEAFRVAPTVLEMVGIQPPPEMDATSLTRVIAGQEPEQPAFMESGYQLDFTLSVWSGDWKLIHVPNKLERTWTAGTEYELYNLRDDPGELHNLYETEPRTAVRLRNMLEEWSAPWVDRAYHTVKTRGVQLDEDMRKRLQALGYLP